MQENCVHIMCIYRLRSMRRQSCYNGLLGCIFCQQSQCQQCHLHRGRISLRCKSNSPRHSTVGSESLVSATSEPDQLLVPVEQSSAVESESTMPSTSGSNQSSVQVELSLAA